MHIHLRLFRTELRQTHTHTRTRAHRLPTPVVMFLNASQRGRLLTCHHRRCLARRTRSKLSSYSFRRIAICLFAGHHAIRAQARTSDPGCRFCGPWQRLLSESIPVAYHNMELRLPGDTIPFAYHVFVAVLYWVPNVGHALRAAPMVRVEANSQAKSSYVRVFRWK